MCPDKIKVLNIEWSKGWWDSETGLYLKACSIYLHSGMVCLALHMCDHIRDWAVSLAEKQPEIPKDE